MSRENPSCFGIPEECIPRDDNGIIQPQEKCRSCELLRECLKEAIAASGGVHKVRAAAAGESTPAEAGGIVGAILRWSARKSAARRGKPS
ncbi:MAG: hypothetical protein JRJ12_10260 [Deltaproteobacteria bacterium]|nr:hypothetical protein [Deltaproteobacteria bacterium]MBW2070619.1 hypothetical protein [Deltaproteobacteria bacterium]